MMCIISDGADILKLNDVTKTGVTDKDRSKWSSFFLIFSVFGSTYARRAFSNMEHGLIGTGNRIKNRLVIKKGNGFKVCRKPS